MDFYYTLFLSFVCCINIVKLILPLTFMKNVIVLQRILLTGMAVLADYFYIFLLVILIYGAFFYLAYGVESPNFYTLPKCIFNCVAYAMGIQHVGYDNVFSLYCIFYTFFAVQHGPD